MKVKGADRIVIKKIYKTTGKMILAIAVFLTIAYAGAVGYVTISAAASRELYRDVSEYARHRGGENALDNFKVRGMDEIWPEEITDNMDAQDYMMLYYNPWDANYLGYLVVEYEKTEYEKEVSRLQGYPSTDYIGNYGAEGFSGYELLAMNAGDDGFVYAITDGEGIIVYVEMVFPGYGMDIEYDRYIPGKYLPAGLDATEDNPTRQRVVEKNKTTQSEI